MSKDRSYITITEDDVEEITELLDKFNVLLTAVSIASGHIEPDGFFTKALRALHDNYETLNSVILDYLAPAGTEVSL